jgi:hypothetical protein
MYTLYYLLFNTVYIKNSPNSLASFLHRLDEDDTVVRLICFFIKRRKANWIGHILRTNCLLKRVIEGRLEGRI